MSVESIVATGRRLIATSLLDRAFIQDRSMVRDTTGGQKETFTERGTAIPARFVQMRDTDPTMELDSVFGPAEAVCEFVVGTVFEEGDRIRNVQDSGIWQIVKDFTPPSATAVVCRAGIRAVN